MVTRELARQEPWWTPGTKHGYHAITFGWLVGEVVHRISGKSLGTYFRDEIAKPLGMDAFIGFDASLDPRVAEIFPAPPPAQANPIPMADLVKDPESVSAKAIMNPPTTMLPTTTNSRAWRGAEIPGANGHANARALARVYGALARGGEVDGVRVMTAAELAALLHRAIQGNRRGSRLHHTLQPRLHDLSAGLANSVQIRTPSAIRGPVDRSDLPTPIPRSASAMR